MAENQSFQAPGTQHFYEYADMDVPILCMKFRDSQPSNASCARKETQMLTVPSQDACPAAFAPPLCALTGFVIQMLEI